MKQSWRVRIGLLVVVLGMSVTVASSQSIFAPGGQGDALTTDPLSQFAATTSAELAGVVSDETGSGLLVFGTSPTFITPALGTPASGVGTNLTGIPASAILAGSFGAGAYVISTSLQAATIELGHATDTTLARSAAGVVTIEGNTILVSGGAAGTPSSIALTNATVIP